jgi:hypothetical protein
VADASDALAPGLLSRRATAWLRDRAGRRHYRILSSDDVLGIRRHETVFIFGSGSSLNDLAAAEWDHFERHDTLSFNWFPHQSWIRIDYHLIREVATNDADEAVWRPALEEYASLLRTNPHYANTVFLVQAGWRAVNGNRLVGLGLLPRGAGLLRFRNRGRDRYEPPSESLRAGLVHSAMTLGDCVNFAYVMGWRTIVLVGVDMYDHRYFWLKPDEARADVDLAGRGLSVDSPFAASEGVTTTLGSWASLMARRGITLSVYNPRSLLAGALPVYARDESERR